jgi:monoamine oxidase
VVADQVILALPFAVLRNLDFSRAGFDARKVAAIRRLGRGRNAKLMAQFNSRLWEGPGPWGVSTGTTFADLPYQSGWEATRAQPGASGILVGYTGGSGTDQYDEPQPYTTSANRDTAESARDLVKGVDRVFPGVARLYNGKANLSQPYRDPNLSCSYSYWRVGQYTTIAGYEAVPQGNIHFAGEHCSLSFQGFMEGGAGQGVRAADEVLGIPYTGDP